MKRTTMQSARNAQEGPLNHRVNRSWKQVCRQHRRVRGWFAVALAVMVCGSPLGHAQGAGYWHTSGNRIVDSNGDEVRIAGVNWYGFETTDYLAHGLWAQDYKTILNTIKSLGFNVIRIPFSNQMVESDPVPSNYTTYANGEPANTALVGQTALADLDTIVAYAGSIGLRVILDNHRSEAGNSNEANGLWYTSAYPQSNWIADWQALAARYSASKFTFNGNPTVIGMDLRNEPHLIANGAYSGACWTGDTETNGSYSGCPASLTSQNWPVAAEAAGNAILAINPKLLIFVEGNDCYDGTCGWQGGNLRGVSSNPVVLKDPDQLVYSAHDYGPNLYAQPWFNSSTTEASLDAIWNKFWGYVSSDGTAPVWLGEFGTDNNASDIENTAAGSQGQWFESLISYLQANPAIGWTYWALNGEDSYGLLDDNYDATPVSAQKESMLDSIQFPLSGGGGSTSCKTDPSTPAGLTAMATSSSGISLGWSAVTPPADCTISSYSVFRSTTSSFTPSSASQVASTSATAFTDSGLAADTTYYYKVEAVDGFGSSAPSLTASATTRAGSGGGVACHVTYSIVNSWPGGFQAAITIQNTGSTAWSSWDLTWTFANGQTIYGLWNGAASQNGANVSVLSLSYNGAIPAGGSYSGVGFTGAWNTTNAVPASFAINGTTCH
jgi:endoglucanase